MKHSTDRILTTHAGSMPRGEPLGAMLIDQEQGKPVDPAKLDAVADERVAYILKKEAEVGIDIANDGEQGTGRLPDLYAAAHGAASAACRSDPTARSSSSSRSSPSG